MRSVETGLRSWMQVVAVISVMLILFWLSQAWPVTLRIQEYVFSGCTMPPDIKETKLGRGYQEASPLVGKNTGIVLVRCCTWKSVPTAISGGMYGYFRGPWVSFVTTDKFWVRVTVLFQELISHELTGYFSAFNLFLTHQPIFIIRM